MSPTAIGHNAYRPGFGGPTMAGIGSGSRWTVAAERASALLAGSDDPRLRASVRLLLAVPLVRVPGPVAVATVAAVGSSGRGSMLLTGLLQGGVFAALLVGWARYVDRRPLSTYGVVASGRWVLDLAVGVAAVVVGHVAWYALGARVGWTRVAAAGGTPDASLVLGLGAVLVALAVNVWVQETVYFAVVLETAAEGFGSRGLSVRRAVLGGWLVSVVFFWGIHGSSMERPELFAAGAIFGLLYVLSGELALPIGVHLGVNYAGAALFAPASAPPDAATVFRVTEAVPGILGAASAARLPQLLVALLLAAAWLRWRRGEVAVDTDIGRPPAR